MMSGVRKKCPMPYCKNGWFLCDCPRRVMFTVARPKVDWRMSRFCASNFAEVWTFLSPRIKLEIEIAEVGEETTYSTQRGIILKGWQIFAENHHLPMNKAETSVICKCLMTWRRTSISPSKCNNPCRIKSTKD